MSNALDVPCDASPARAAEPAGQADHPRLVIATTLLAWSLAFVDSSVVNVDLSAIAANFHADAGDLQCVVNACSVAKRKRNCCWNYGHLCSQGRHLKTKMVKETHDRYSRRLLSCSTVHGSDRRRGMAMQSWREKSAIVATSQLCAKQITANYSALNSMHQCTVWDDRRQVQTAQLSALKII
jgi:hypothetical protein